MCVCVFIIMKTNKIKLIIRKTQGDRSREVVGASQERDWQLAAWGLININY